MNDDNLIMIVVKVEPSNYQHISITGYTTICVINGTLSVHSKILEHRNIIQKLRNLGFDVLESKPQKTYRRLDTGNPPNSLELLGRL